MIRTRILAAVGIALALVLTACGGDPEPEPVAEATTVSATPNANQVECVNIERAYNAWSMGRLFTAEDFATTNEFLIKDEMKDQQEFLSEVSGYSDQASKNLAVALAGLGVELGMVNVQLTIGDAVEPDQAKKAADAMVKVQDDYDAWKTATCG